MHEEITVEEKENHSDASKDQDLSLAMIGNWPMEALDYCYLFVFIVLIYESVSRLGCLTAERRGINLIKLYK